MSTEPRRAYGLSTGIYVVVASMVGAGILTTSGYTLRETGNPWSLLALWAVGGLMALAGALTIAEMATMLPRVGGDYLFAREAFGPGTAIMVGWATFILGFAAPIAVIARLATSYMLGDWLALLPGPWPAILEPGLAVTLIAACACAHAFSHNHSASTQATTTVIKLAILSGMVMAGLTLGTGSWAHFRVGGWPASTEWMPLASSLIYVSYAYAGWNGAAYLAGEIRDPGRLLPRALVGGCLLVTLLYLAMNTVYIFAIDPVAISAMSPGEVGRVAELAMTNLFGSGVARSISVILGVGMVASVSAYLMSGSRVVVAMAADGAFFSMAGGWHPTRGTPIGAIVSLALVACILACSGSFLQLLDYTSTGLTAVSALVVAGIFPLHQRLGRGVAFRMPLYPLPPLIVLGLSIWTITAVLMQEEKQIPALLSLATIAVGAPLAGWLKKPVTTEPEIRA